MFYPGSGSPNFSSRIPAPGVKNTGSRILLYIKEGRKIKSTFFLLLMVSGTSFII
jgi:hypothetical protein